MSALVTDQFRILNASNFIESIDNGSNSYYVWVGLVNPDINSGIGRNPNWDDGSSPNTPVVPNPVDSFNHNNHYKDTLLFGKKITTSNIRRVVKRIDWSGGKKYDMYRHDYSIENPSPISKRYRLYDSNYYVMNSEYKVYICIQNGSSGINSTGNQSQFEPTFTDLEPSVAGTGEDGYVWKYLFTVSASDIVKFDSTEYISLPNNWETSSDSQIISVRENGDSRINNNQIKTVYIDNPGRNYTSSVKREVDILGDGTGGKVSIETNSNGEIIDTVVTSGGKGYTYGIVDLGILQPGGSLPNPAKLIPIIPPSYGHGYDLYKELGADKILIYSRFDDSTRDFPIDTKFCQVGILRSPSNFSSSGIFSGSQFSNLYSIKITNQNNTPPVIGEKISQTTSGALGYIASYDGETKVLKYFKDRSLYYNKSTYDQRDYVGISTEKNANVNFTSNGNITGTGGFSGSVDVDFSGITTTVNNKIINLGVEFNNGFANPEINRKTGDVLYIDNRPLITRNIRQKEDIKIILEF
jgi:hypothetical protein